MMTSMAPSSSWFFFLLDVASLATLASAATFTVRNNCGFTVWPAAIPVGGGTQLNPGWTWTFDAPRGTSGRVWGRSGCSFNGWWGHCSSGDCGGAYSCSLSGQPPATLAEFSISRGGAAHDYYDISVVDGYNLPMDFSCSSGAGLRCRGSGCPDAYLYPTDDSKTHACDGNSNYQVTFCP